MQAGRRAALLGAVSTLGGCGFHPLYASLGRPTPPSAQLASISVAVMGERTGQLLRQALQRRFDGSGDAGVPRLYELSGGLSVGAEGIAIQRDSTSTRLRYIGTATFTLRRLDVQHTVLLSGTAKVLDGANVFDSEYFALDLEAETIQRRCAETCADQITLQVATFLQQQAAAKA